MRKFNLGLALVLLGLGGWVAIEHASQTDQTVGLEPKAPSQPLLEASASPSQVQPVAVKARAQAVGRFEQTEAGTFKSENAKRSVEVQGDRSVAVYSRMDHANTVPATEARGIVWTLESIRHGEAALYSVTDSKPATEIKLAAGEREVRFERGAHMAERLRLLPDGVEVLWDLPALPPGSGDLTFQAKLDTPGLLARPAAEASGGVYFQDRTGSLAMRVGRMLARDAGGQEITVEPTWEAAENRIAYALDGRWLADAAYPVTIDPIIVLDGNQFVISNVGDTDPTSPGIAATDTHAFIMYNDLANRKVPVMRGKVISRGSVSANEVQLTLPAFGEVPLGIAPQRTQVASDGDEFLAIWIDISLNVIVGSVIEENGSIRDFGDVDDPQVLIGVAITSGKIANELPLITSIGPDRYVVVFHDRVGTGTQMKYVFVDTNAGTASTPQLIPGPSVPVRNQYGFFLTAGPADTALLTFRESNERPVQTRVIRIEDSGANGALLDPQGISVFNDNRLDLGFGAPIGVGWDDATDTWHILSSHDQRGETNIFRHLVRDDGFVTPSDGTVFTNFGLAPSGLTLEDAYPTAFFGANVALPAGGTGPMWFMIHSFRTSTTAYHFLGKRLLLNGTDLDQEPFQIDDADTTPRRNPIAAAIPDFFNTAPDGDTSRFLAVWLESGTFVPNIGLSVDGRYINTKGDPDATDDLVARLDTSSPGGDPVFIKQNATVDFDFAGSSGLAGVNEQRLFYGDGGTVLVPVGTETASRKIAKTGKLFSSISLKDGSYLSLDVLPIVSGLGTEPIGPDVQVDAAGFPAETANFNGNMALNRIQFTLDFSQSTPNDTVLIQGVLDRQLLPDELAGQAVTVSLGSLALTPGNGVFDNAPVDGPFTATFFIDHQGDFLSSDGLAEDRMFFDLNPITGAFTFQIAKGRLSGSNHRFLITDEDGTYVNPSRKRRIQFGLDVGASDFGNSTAVVLYTGRPDQSGVGNYFDKGTGEEDTGFLTFKTATFTEVAVNNKITLMVDSFHTVTLAGRLMQPGGTVTTTDLISLPADLTGKSFRFQVGEFDSGPLDLAAALATKRLIVSTSTITYKGVKGDLVTSFKINRLTGDFTLKLLKVPDGAPGIGLPLAKLGKGAEELGVLADVFVGFRLDLRDMPTATDFTYNASAYTRIFRTLATQRAWKIKLK
ncbi:MAG: hypothetical protein AMXMBFR7_42520 [Planctomycetota bacterium]